MSAQVALRTQPVVDRGVRESCGLDSFDLLRKNTAAGYTLHGGGGRATLIVHARKAPGLVLYGRSSELMRADVSNIHLLT